MLLNKKKIFLGTAQFLSNYGATNFIGLKSNVFLAIKNKHNTIDNTDDKIL